MKSAHATHKCRFCSCDECGGREFAWRGKLIGVAGLVDPGSFQIRKCSDNTSSTRTYRKLQTAHENHEIWVRQLRLNVMKGASSG